MLMTATRIGITFRKCGKSPLAISLLVAASLWFAMFSPWTAPHINFWGCMTLSACILTCFAIFFGGRESFGKGDGTSLVATCLWGFVIAILLWGIFYAGDKISQLLLPFSRAQVILIYNIRGDVSPILLSMLLLFVIGPAEEIFWRGYVQRTLSDCQTPLMAFMLTTGCYTIVHLPSGNFMLIMAALSCGIVWGGLYWLMPHKLKAIIVSHALWDAAAFIWFPF